MLHQLGPDIQWVQSYVTQDRLYCIYLATDAALIKKHADISGFPASKITETRRVIDPTTRHRTRADAMGPAGPYLIARCLALAGPKERRGLERPRSSDFSVELALGTPRVPRATPRG